MGVRLFTLRNLKKNTYSIFLRILLICGFVDFYILGINAFHAYFVFQQQQIIHSRSRSDIPPAVSPKPIYRPGQVPGSAYSRPQSDYVVSSPPTLHDSGKETHASFQGWRPEGFIWDS